MSLSISHVAERNRLLSGETLILRTRIRGSYQDWASAMALGKLTLDIAITLIDRAPDAAVMWPRVLRIAQVSPPRGFVPNDTAPSPEKIDKTNSTGLETNTGVMLKWITTDGFVNPTSAAPGAPDATLCFETQVQLVPHFGSLLDAFLRQHRAWLQLDRERDWLVYSSATASGLADNNRMLLQDATVIAVQVMSRAAKNLPALYRGWDNDLLGRFLMMSDTQLGRATRMLDHVECYADPMLAPATLLPWLMSWGGLLPDAAWPELPLRKLINRLLYLRRMRGTTLALREHIQLYTGHAPQISEPGVSNVQLSETIKLGPQLILGASTQPHEFDVIAWAQWASDEERNTHLRIIADIIAFHCPAHARQKGKLRLEDWRKTAHAEN